MQIHIPPMDESEILRLLTEEYQFEKNKAALIAKQSVQDMGRALAVAQNTVMNFKDELAAWFRAIVGRKGHELAAWSNKMGSQEKEEQKQFALFTISFVRNILWTHAGKNASDLPVEGAEMIRYLNENYNPEAWHQVIQGLQTGFEKISRNANTKLLWLFLSVSVKNQLMAYRLQHINS
jgi:hypothetical protein